MRSTRKKPAKKSTRAKLAHENALFRAMVKAVREYVAEVHPDANLVEICDWLPMGCSSDVGTIAQFHADPDNDGPHTCFGAYHSCERKKCLFCRGDRRAAEGGGA